MGHTIGTWITGRQDWTGNWKLGNVLSDTKAMDEWMDAIHLA